MVQWFKEATKSKVRGNDGNTYDCASFEEIPGKRFMLQDKQWGVSQIATKDENTQVFVAMPDKMGEWSDEELLTLARDLQMNYYDASSNLEGADIPMINLNLQVEQNWINGMKSDGWFVSACLQQFILKLNEKGATAKSAAAMSYVRCMSISHKQRLTIDKPFLIWFSRSGITYPAFLAVCGYDCWAAPADLS